MISYRFSLNGVFGVAKKKEPSEAFQNFVINGCKAIANQSEVLKWYIRLYGARQSATNRLLGQMNYLDPLIRRLMKYFNCTRVIASRYFMATLVITCKNPATDEQADEFRKLIAERKGNEIAAKAVIRNESVSYKIERDFIKDDPSLMRELCRIAGETESLTVGPVTKKAKRELG